MIPWRFSFTTGFAILLDYHNVPWKQFYAKPISTNAAIILKDRLYLTVSEELTRWQYGMDTKDGWRQRSVPCGTTEMQGNWKNERSPKHGVCGSNSFKATVKSKSCKIASTPLDSQSIHGTHSVLVRPQHFELFYKISQHSLWFVHVESAWLNKPPCRQPDPW